MLRSLLRSPPRLFLLRSFANLARARVRRPPVSTWIRRSRPRLTVDHRPKLEPYESLYKHFHANPELSNQEKETAAAIVSHLHDKISSDFDIRPNIGGHGIAALFHNGDGPTVLLRADFDALPVEERTGLEYASKKRMKDADGIEKPVMHACGWVEFTL